MRLEPAHEELLVGLVEASRDLPREKQTWHVLRHMGGASLIGPGGSESVVEDDVRYLAECGLLRTTWLRHGFTFRLAPAATDYYLSIKQRVAEPVARQEGETRRLIEAEAFRAAYPRAYSRWSEAESLLWAAQSEREYTTVGHKTREAMQEFATEVVARYQPPSVDANSALVNRRLGAVIAMFLPSLGEARASLLKALGDYSEATMEAIQRQEHGGLKEGHALTWRDARRVVFHTASVMYEFAVSLDEAESVAPPPAVMEGG